MNKYYNCGGAVTILLLGGKWLTSGALSDIINVKKDDAKSIYCALVYCLKQRQLQVSRIVGMDFDGGSTFSGCKTGV